MHLDRRIASLAARQQNLVSISQLRDLGVGRGAVRRRVASGHLYPQHRGVFAVGSPLLPPLGRERAALLAVPGAVLSHGSAAAVWGVMPAHPSGPVHLLTSTQRRSRPGIEVHRTHHLPAADVRSHRGLFLTSPVRSTLDLTGQLSAGALERLVAEVIARDPHAKEQLAARGTKRLHDIMRAGPRRTRSGVERRLLRLIRDAGLPAPRTNVFLCGEEVDAHWPGHALVVEVDTYATHGDRIAFERDRRKDAKLAARGYTVVRVTDRQLDIESTRTVALLAQALTQAAAPRAARAGAPAP